MLLSDRNVSFNRTSHYNSTRCTTALNIKILPLNLKPDRIHFFGSNLLDVCSTVKGRSSSILNYLSGIRPGLCTLYKQKSPSTKPFRIPVFFLSNFPILCSQLRCSAIASRMFSMFIESKVEVKYKQRKKRRFSPALCSTAKLVSFQRSYESD